MRHLRFIASVIIFSCGCAQDFATARIADGEVTVSSIADFTTQVDGGFTLELVGARDSGATASELHLSYVSACGVDTYSVSSEDITWTHDFPLIVEPGVTLRIPFAVHGQTYRNLIGQSTCPVYVHLADVTRYDHDAEGELYVSGAIAITN